MDLDGAIQAWRQLLGAERILEGIAAQEAYGQDTGGLQRVIPAALRIVDSKAIPEIMRIASKHRVAVYPISTGQNWGYGTALPVRDSCVILDLRSLDKILHFDPEFGIVTLEPGVTQQMLADFLDAGNHPFLVPVTGAGPTCSLLANALERGYGVTPYTDHFGAVTDLEAVLADGSLYRTALREAGGEELARLFKWGLGPYSTGMFTQSGLGVVTHVTITLARRPDCVKVCLFSLKKDELLEPAIERVRSILGRLPGVVGAVNLMNRHRVLAMAAPYPSNGLDQEGLIAPHVIEELGRQYQIFPWTGFGTLYGTHSIVAAAQKEIRSALAGVASRLIFLSPQRAQTLAKVAGALPGAMGKRLASTADTLAQSLELVAGRPNETALPLAYWRNPTSSQGQWRHPSKDGCGLIWYAPLVPMRPRSVRTYVDMIHAVSRKHAMEPLITFTTVNDKLLDSTVPLIFERNRPKAVRDAQSCYDELLITGREQGFFPYRVGIGAMDKIMELQSHAKEFHRRLRDSLDPHDILAPGRYI